MIKNNMYFKFGLTLNNIFINNMYYVLINLFCQYLACGK